MEVNSHNMLDYKMEMMYIIETLSTIKSEFVFLFSLSAVKKYQIRVFSLLDESISIYGLLKSKKQNREDEEKNHNLHKICETWNFDPKSIFQRCSQI